MRFTTTEDYNTLLESIKEIDAVSLKPKTVLTEASSKKTSIFESIGDQSVEVEIPETKSFNTIALKSSVGAV